jgi:hypothetical protein
MTSALAQRFKIGWQVYRSTGMVGHWTQGDAISKWLGTRLYAPAGAHNEIPLALERGEPPVRAPPCARPAGGQHAAANTEGRHASLGKAAGARQ